MVCDMEEVGDLVKEYLERVQQTSAYTHTLLGVTHQAGRVEVE
jgi:hypothetical protein